MNSNIERAKNLTDQLRNEREERIVVELSNLVGAIDVPGHLEAAMQDAGYVDKLRRRLTITEAATSPW